MSTSIAIRITERSAASYLPLEWRETRRFSPRLLPKILNSISSVSMSFSLSDLINNPTLLPTFMDLDPATAYGEMGQAVDESMIIKDKEGLGLVVFFKKGLQWPWEPTREVNRVVSGAVTTLVSRYSPPPPSRTDLRHREFNKDVQSNCGVYHFALWVATGQGNAANPKHPTPHQAILSRDILSAAYKTDTVLQFYRSLAPIIQTIGILFEGLDHAGYSRYRANWNYLVGITPLKLLEVSQRQCFLGMAILHGLKVAIHKDKGDVKDGWVAMICCGEFEGGDLCMPGLGLKLHHRPGDVVFLRSSLLEHFVSDFDGSRTSLVFFSHENLIDTGEGV